MKMPSIRAVALASALLFAAMPRGTQAFVVVTGPYWTEPGGAVVAGSTINLPHVAVWMGNKAAGSLLVTQGSFAALAAMSMANNGGSATGMLDGVGSILELHGPWPHRFTVGNAGPATFTVSGGALLDARANAAACNVPGMGCSGVVAASAGVDATLTITGAGSEARFLNTFAVAVGAVINDAGYGTPGGQTVGRVNVLDGGTLTTSWVQAGSAADGAPNNGQEYAYALLRVEGPGSTWRVTGSSAAGQDALVSNGIHARSQAEWTITDGGRLLIEAETGRQAQLRLAHGGGWSQMLVSGAQSRLRLAGQAASIHVGEAGGFARLVLAQGAQAELAGLGQNTLNIGLAGSEGNAFIESGARLTGLTTLSVGTGGEGALLISGGGRLEMLDTATPGLFIGDGRAGAAAVGMLVVEGAGSQVGVRNKPGSLSPAAFVGLGAKGSLTLQDGAQLTLEGASTTGMPGATRLSIGQSLGGAAPGTGTVSISGAGSRLSLLGVDPIVYVGRSGGTGTLGIGAGGELVGTVVDVGIQGGTGRLEMDAGRMTLSGQWGSSDVGAILALGAGNGSRGTAVIGNGSELTFSNMGGSGAGLLLGGINSAPLGQGELQVSGGSRITIDSLPGKSAAIIGLGGTGTARFDEGSALFVRAGELLVARDPGSTGRLELLGGSAARARFAGIGATATGDGGQGTLILGEQSSLAAPRIEIGTQGFVGGTGRLIGQVINRGIISPGHSPGTLTIEGEFLNAPGGRLVLEIASAGGGFVTDELLFSDASLAELGGLEISFRFLGDADPNAFLASGAFVVERFFGLEGGGELAHEKFATASFTASAEGYAISGFSFSAAAGASFSAVPVPEPGAALLMLLGLGALAARGRRLRG